jgi:RHS repeat-associated protein
VYSLYAQSGQLLFQRDERSSKRRQYIYLGGSLVAESDMPLTGSTTTVTYQHTDALGSPVATTNSAKTVLQRSEYEPYGYLLNRPMEDGPGYTGHATDATTGLVYMQQRYYDPIIGRLLSRDEVTAYEKPLTSFNAYVYANNNPYRFTDPDGRDSASCYGDGGCGGDNSFYASREKLEGLAGNIPGVDLGLCARSGCGAGGWVLAGLGAIPGEGKAAQVGIRVTRASLNRVKTLIKALSKADAKAKPLTQGKVEKLERIVEKVGGTLRNDGDSGVKGSSAGTPHVQTEGLGNKTDSRHIWTEPDVKLKDEK